jgi:regulator of sigma E protease
LDTSEPVTGTPNPTAAPAAPAPKTFLGWVTANALPLAFTIGIIAFLIYKNLIVFDVVLAALGLGLVIFIHELGHFLAAKWCDVHVETFSIGFGKPLPGCSFRWGETTYKIGWIPLGGYVKMVGEGDNADTEEAEEDPRSFKHKTVGQRMLIISAGVIMNLLLGSVCFVAAYMHGVEETPAIVGNVGVGSPAWQQDLRLDTRITQIKGITKPTFDDIKPTVMSADKGEEVLFKLETGGGEREAHLQPRRSPDDLYPMVGISPIEQLTLIRALGRNALPYVRNSAAAQATAVEDGSHFQTTDRIVGSSHDPANPADVKEIPLDTRDPSGTKRSAAEFLRRQYRMRGKPFHVVVARDGNPAPLTFVIPPAWTQTLPGVRFQMGRVAALRATGPAAKATPVVPGQPGLQPANPDESGSGDKLTAIEVPLPDGSRRRYVDEFSGKSEAGVTEVRFDPLRLPHELEMWAEESKADHRTVRITVLRFDPAAKKEVPREYDATWDPNLVFNGETPSGLSTPIAISGLGLAYFVNLTIDTVAPDSAAANAGLAKSDKVIGVRFKELTDSGEVKDEKWMELGDAQGVILQYLMQAMPVSELTLKVKQVRPEGENDVEVPLTAVADPTWPAVSRGLRFQSDTRIQQASGPLEALQMGLHRTLRTIRVIYQTLYATVWGQISPKTLSGPLSIANASYKIVGYDIWQFILFIGLININLAIVNFLPIPLLDGGHMVFLAYEKIRGKPAPEKVIEWSLYAGLAFILLLMAFVIFLDVRRLFF